MGAATSPYVNAGRKLTENERRMLAQCSRFGSDAISIVHYKGANWNWQCCDVRGPCLYRTKREAVEGSQAFYAILCDIDTYWRFEAVISEHGVPKVLAQCRASLECAVKWNDAEEMERLPGVIADLEARESRAVPQ